MEDCASGRVNVVPALIAGVRRTTGYPMMFGDAPADLAFNAIWVQVLPQPLQASGIVGKLGLEIANGVANCFRLNVIPELLVCHDLMVSEQLPTVKG